MLGASASIAPSDRRETLTSRAGRSKLVGHGATTHLGDRGLGVLGIAPLRAPDRGRSRGRLPRQLLHGYARERRSPARQPPLRADASRRHGPAHDGGRRGLSPGLPGLAHPLPAQPRAHDPHGGRGHAQHARARARGQGAHPHRLDVGDLRRSGHPPAGRVVLGQRQPHRAARLLRRGQALRRDARGLIRAPVRRPGAHRAHLQHLRPAHARERRPRRLELRRAGAPATETPHDLRRGPADALVLLRERSHRGLRALSYGEPARRRPREHQQPARDDGARAAPEIPSASSRGRAPRSSGAAAGKADDPTRRRPDISRAQQLLDNWGPKVPLEQGLQETIDDFRKRLAL